MANIAKQERKTKMYSLVEAWQNSSSSKKEFCLENNVTVGIFSYWLKKYKNTQSLEFVEIKAEPTPQNSNSNTIVKFNFSGNICAEVPAELALKFMHQLISV